MSRTAFSERLERVRQLHEKRTGGCPMRWLIRLILLALAAFGAKTLYDRWHGEQTTPSRPMTEPEPYLQEVRTELEQVVAAPYDADLGIPVET
jgi:hypothetical protein